MSDLKCCFLGHRKITVTEELKQKISNVIENLIVNAKVSTFLFGSRSDFNNLCHTVVNQLKLQYPTIKRVAYTCKNETCFFANEKEKWKTIFLRNETNNQQVLEVDAEYEHATKYQAGKAAYLERNQALINDSDYCVFYYDENYQPKKRKHSRQTLNYYQPQSGTKIAYHYAQQKKKTIINVFC